MYTARQGEGEEEGEEEDAKEESNILLFIQKGHAGVVRGGEWCACLESTATFSWCRRDKAIPYRTTRHRADRQIANDDTLPETVRSEAGFRRTKPPLEGPHLTLRLAPPSHPGFRKVQFYSLAAPDVDAEAVQG
jgi:hypothetical protein